MGLLMKIAFLVYEYPPRLVGGLGIYAAEMTRKYEEMGHGVVVFTMNDGRLPTHEGLNGIEVHRPLTCDISDSVSIFVAEELRRWGTGLKFFADVFAYNILSATKLVNDLVKRQGRKFEIISAHDWLSLIAGMAIRRELKLPLVFHVHSTEKGRAANYGSRVLSEIEHSGGQKADLIITVSQAMKEELKGLGFPEQKIAVCYNGIHPEKYDPSKADLAKVERLRSSYGISQKDRMIFFIGRLTAIKGVDRLILAMPRVLHKMPNARLVIVGKGELLEHTQNLIGSLGLGNCVTVRPEFISEEERILHYAACDVAAFPSLYEPFGIVSLEAMSMAKPVVVGASGTSGMREQVTPSGPHQCGIHVNPSNPEDIAWGILSILEDSEAAKRFGENGRRRVLEEFTIDAAAKRTIGLYEDLLRNKTM